MVVLICISLRINIIGHYFIFLLAIFISSLEKCLLKPSAHFLNGSFFFFFLSHLYVFFGKCLLSSLSLVGCFSDVEFYKLLILDVNPLSDMYFTNIFLPFYRLPFHVVDILFFLAVQNLQFDVILLLYFFFCYLCFSIVFKRNCHHQCQWTFYHCFLLGFL